MSNEEITDSELVASARRGNKDAFAVLYDRYARLVRAVCCETTRELAAAQDLTQEVFLKAYQRLATLRDAHKFGGWIVGIARLSAKEWQRERNRDRQRLHAGQLEREDISALKPTDDRLAILLEILEELPAQERLALEAFYLQQCNAQKAATIVGVSRSGLYKLLDRAKQRLLKRYKQSEEPTP